MAYYDGFGTTWKSSDRSGSLPNYEYDDYDGNPTLEHLRIYSDAKRAPVTSGLKPYDYGSREGHKHDEGDESHNLLNGDERREGHQNVHSEASSMNMNHMYAADV